MGRKRDNKGRFVESNRTCSIIGCENKHWAKGLCKKHYKKQYQMDNKEKIAKQVKQYRMDNKEEIATQKKAWYQEKREEIAKKQKQYYQNNKEKIAEYWKQHCKDHKEEKAEYRRQYYETHKEELAKKQKQYKKTPKGKASHKADSHNRRARTKDLTKETVQRVYEHNILKYGALTCILCGKPIKLGEDSLEHLTPLSRGGTNDYDNLGIAHGRESTEKCNNKKFRKTLGEWIAMKGKRLC